MEEEKTNKDVMHLWLKATSILARDIVVLKKKLVRAGILVSFGLIFLILIHELLLAVLTLPFYLFFDRTQQQRFFNQEGWSYTLYQQRRRVVLPATVFATLLLAVYMSFSSGIFASSPPVVNLSSSQMFSQTTWSAATSTTSTVNAASAITGISVSTTGTVELSTSTGWFDGDWPYRRAITIPSSQITSTLTNFPVLITEANLSGTNFFSRLAHGDGGDIIFTSSDGTTQLNREVVSINPGGETMETWVNVPSISSSSDTIIYVYYGNTSSTDPTDLGTWNSNYAAVWHFDEDPSVTTDGSCSGSAHVCDSTSNGNHGFAANFSSGSEGSAQIGNGYTFNGTSQYIDVGSGSSLSTLNPLSFTFWMNPDSASASNRKAIMTKRGGTCNSGGDWFFEYDDTANIWFNGQFNSVTQTLNFEQDSSAPGGDLETVGPSFSITEDVWQYGSLTVDSSFTPSGTVMYVNATEVASYPHHLGGDTPDSDANCDLYIGAQSPLNYYFSGELDELRISTVSHSADWLAAEYLNQVNPSSFYSVGSEQFYRTSSGTLVSNVFDVGNTSSAWGTIRFTTDVSASTTVRIRTASSSDMSGATAWGSCTAVTVDSDITSNSCVTDGHQYMQYQVTLVSGVTTSPSFQDITIQSINTSTLSVAESAGSVILTASLDEVSTSTVTVPYTVAGTATGGGTDHDLSDGNITVTAGALSGTTSISITDDGTDEADETIIVTMGTPTGGTVGGVVTTTITITDDDAGPSVTLSADTTSFSEGSEQAIITATLSTTSAFSVTTHLAFSGTATTGTNDYSVPQATIVISAGETTGTLTITSLDDSDIEGNESIIVDIDSVTNGSEQGTAQVTLTVTDNDTAGGAVVIPIVLRAPTPPPVISTLPTELPSPDGAPEQPTDTDTNEDPTSPSTEDPIEGSEANEGQSGEQSSGGGQPGSSIQPDAPPPPGAQAPEVDVQEPVEFTQYLYRTLRGTQVRALQRILKSLGFFPEDVAATGYFGPITQQAVRAFQQANNLPPVGVVGPRTRALLNGLSP